MPDTITIPDRVRTILYEHLSGYQGVNFSKDFPWEARLVEDLRADSLDVVELTMAFEEEFNIEIADDEADGWTTAGDVLRTIEGKR
jgi:acyl carrier protein